MEDLGRAALRQASKPLNPTEASHRRETGQAAPQSQSQSQSATTISQPVGGTGVDYAATNGGRESSTTVRPHEALTDTLLSGGTGINDSDMNAQLPNEYEPGLSLPGFDAHLSPDWLNFDAAFENFDAVLGSSGADLSMELLRPLNFEDFGAYGFPR